MTDFHAHQAKTALSALYDFFDLFKKRIERLPADQRDQALVEITVAKHYLRDLEYCLEQLKKSNGGNAS